MNLQIRNSAEAGRLTIGRRELDPKLMVPAEQGSHLDPQGRRVGSDAGGERAAIDPSVENSLPTLDHQVHSAAILQPARTIERPQVPDGRRSIRRSGWTAVPNRGDLRQTDPRLPRSVVTSPAGAEANAVQHELYITLSDWLSTTSTADW